MVSPENVAIWGTVAFFSLLSAPLVGDVGGGEDDEDVRCKPSEYSIIRHVRSALVELDCKG